MYEGIKELEYIRASDTIKTNNLLKEGWIILNTFQEKDEQDSYGCVLFGKQQKGFEGCPKLAD